MTELMHQGIELSNGRRLNTVKAHDAVLIQSVNAIQKQYVEMNVKIQC